MQHALLANALLVAFVSTATVSIPELGLCMESVIGQVAGTLPFSVSYAHDLRVSDGMELAKAQAAHAPGVHFSGSHGKLYSLIMIDPDAPSPDNPTMAQWLHWLVSNIPADGDMAKGDTITPYAGPTPPRGVHRYIFLLYEQEEGAKMVPTRIEQRGRFNAASWAQQHGMVPTPVAAMHFKTRAG